ncbi:MAG: flavodoxin family protein [Desulfobacterales bacterium]|jgi:hypothetical protein|nr:flavodoxin family protein [Desulfobacterales bacterium]
MKKVLGVIGSPRKLGNCEVMIKEISRNISEPHELQLLRLSDFNVLSCKACYKCLFDEGECVLQDEFGIILAAMCEADAIILAAPTYYLGANSSLKRFIDRGFAFYPKVDQLWGTPSVGICIAAIPGKEGHGLLGVENFLKMAMSDIKLTRVAYAASPGDVFFNDTNKATAADLAGALFSPARKPEGPRCPLCGGDTFRLLGNMSVRCMLCSNEGTMDTSTGEPVLAINRSDHELFLTKSDIIDHKNWLVGAKNRFLDQKAALKAVSVNYRQDGTWIKPLK